MLQVNQIVRRRYKIIRTIAQGGVRSIHLAQDTTRADQIVAVEEIFLGYGLPDNERLEQQQAENRVSLQGRLSHPSIPKIYDFFEENHMLITVSEYVQGRTLEERVAARPIGLPESLVVSWGAQLCDALSYLHYQTPPIIYRDLKPSTVLITDSDEVKLIDFGLARVFKPGKRSDTNALGTPGYAPPEQYGTAQTDARTDVYSLGVTLLYLLTGYEPKPDPVADLPRADRLNKTIGKDLADVISRATQKRSASRFQTADEFKTALLKRQPPATGYLPSAAAPRFCNSCGAANPRDSFFCEKCGLPLNFAYAPSPSQAAYSPPINPIVNQPSPPPPSAQALQSDELQEEPIRMDVACLKQVVIEQVFEIAVAMRQVNSPSLSVPDLTQLHSSIGTLFKRPNQNFIRLKVRVSAPDCFIPISEYTFQMRSGSDSEIGYFQLVAKRAGNLRVLITAHQEDEALVTSTRTMVEVTLEAVSNLPIDPQVARPQLTHEIEQRKRAYTVLCEQFALTDLEEICFLCNVDYEMLEGTVKRTKAMKLIQHFTNRNQFDQLVAAVHLARPGVEI